MSARDYQEFQAKLPALVGRKCFFTLATNSVKLHIDRDQKGGTYLWIDPPWQFERDGEIIESSASCPHRDEEAYEPRFLAWAAAFDPIRESRIQQIAASPDGSLRIHLHDRYAVFVPKDFHPRDRPAWYDHWYLRQRDPNKSPDTNALPGK